MRTLAADKVDCFHAVHSHLGGGQTIIILVVVVAVAVIAVAMIHGILVTTNVVDPASLMSSNIFLTASGMASGRLPLPLLPPLILLRPPLSCACASPFRSCT